MNLDSLQSKLIESARQAPPSQQVPYAFQKRILARLPTGLSEDPWSVWSRALWRAAAPCVVISMMLTAWSFVEPDLGAGGPDLAQQFEETILAGVQQDALNGSGW